MKGRKRSQHNHGRSMGKHFAICPKRFIFLDKKTGSQRFELPANADGSISADHAASLLAVQCLMRGQMPADFTVMIAPRENLLDGLERRAWNLIHACHEINLPAVNLTGRQKEVLCDVLQTFSNKEIALKLNVTERTVKFHVSALLMKFDVVGRVSLMRKVTDMLSSGRISLGMNGPQSVANQAHGPESRLSGPRSDQVRLIPLKTVSR
jgi:DNA-binding CsgD family transcriptional regulator